jgi:hypothetical protein
VGCVQTHPNGAASRLDLLVFSGRGRAWALIVRADAAPIHGISRRLRKTRTDWRPTRSTAGEPHLRCASKLPAQPSRLVDSSERATRQGRRYWPAKVVPPGTPPSPRSPRKRMLFGKCRSRFFAAGNSYLPFSELTRGSKALKSMKGLGFGGCAPVFKSGLVSSANSILQASSRCAGDALGSFTR